MIDEVEIVPLDEETRRILESLPWTEGDAAADEEAGG
jgi:hypothetical protein